MTISRLSKDHFGRGLCWFNYDYKNDIAWGHGGGDPGINTLMIFRPKVKMGAIIFANTGNAGLDKILRKLL